MVNWLRRLWRHIVAWTDRNEPIEWRRHAPDYPKDRAEAFDLMANWPQDYWTDRQFIAAHQLTRTPPGDQ